MKRELKRRGLPIYGNKSALLERCRLNGVSCSDGADSTGPPVGPATAAERPRPSTGSGSVTAGAASAPARSHEMGASVGGRGDPDARVADGPAPGLAAQGLLAVPTTVPPPNLSAARALPERAAQPSAAAAAGSSTRAPPFSKHEKVRLAHVMCTGEVAAGVVVSRGPMSRRQQDARASRDAVWVVVVAEMFNSTDRFTVPDECIDAELDPNIHPHVRTGTLLKAKWSEVRCASYASLLYSVCNNQNSTASHHSTHYGPWLRPCINIDSDSVSFHHVFLVNP